MTIRDFFTYSPISIFIVTGLILVASILLPIWENRGATSEDTSKQDKKNDKKSQLFNNMPFVILAILIVLFSILYSKQVMFIFGMLLLLFRITELSNSVVNVHKSFVTNSRVLSKHKKSIIVFATSIGFFIPLFLPDSINTLSIKGDFGIILMFLVSRETYTLTVLLLVGLLLNEIARIIHSKHSWTKLVGLLSKKPFRIFLLNDIYNKINRKITGAKQVVRPFLYLMSFIICIILAFLLAVLYLIQWSLYLIILTATYIVRFIEFVFREINKCSDTGFISFLIRMSIVISFVLTEMIIVRSELVADESVRAYEYISQAVLIPIIVSDAIRIKDRLKSK